MVPTAQLIRAERLTPTLTGHHVSTVSRPELEMSRARSQEVFATTNNGTNSTAFVRSNCHRNVETVDEGDTVGG